MIQREIIKKTVLLFVLAVPACESPLLPEDPWIFPNVTVLSYRPYDGKGGAVVYQIELRDSTDIPSTSYVFRNQKEDAKFYREYCERNQNLYEESIPYAPGWTKLESPADSVTLVLKGKADLNEKRMAFNLWE